MSILEPCILFVFLPFSSASNISALEQIDSFHAAVKVELRRLKATGALDGDDSPRRLAELLLAATDPPRRIEADKILWHGMIFNRDWQIDQLYAHCCTLEPRPSAAHATHLEPSEKKNPSRTSDVSSGR